MVSSARALTMHDTKRYDLAILGAGPIGLELAVALRLLGVNYVHFDARQIGHTISWYPRQVRFFSSNDRIAIAGVPLNTPDQSKASREDYLAYLRAVCTQFDLAIRTDEPVTALRREGDGFVLTTRRREVEHTCHAHRVVLAVGDMHQPRMLSIDGEDLPHVSHYFVEAHDYFRQRLLIVGGRNSAVEAAIRCHHLGAQVTLSYRRATFDDQSIKYWLLPELEVLIKTGAIAFHPETVPVAITPSHVRLGSATTNGEDAAVDVATDFVLLLTGYGMNPDLFIQAGVSLDGENRAPRHDPRTMETNVPGLYVAGTTAAGTQQRFRLFIENCHAHVDKIVRAVTGKPCPFAARDVTHSGRYTLPES